jgi:hypothetical protein
VLASVALAACTGAGEPLADDATGSVPADTAATPFRSASPGTDGVESSTAGNPTSEPEPPGVAGQAGELRITTQSHVTCPQIGPSPKSECGFRPLPKVTIEIAAYGTEPTMVRTGDDGTVDVPVGSGNITVTGTAVAEYPWTPDPVEIEITPGGTGDVVLIYTDGPQVPPPPR